MNEKVIECIPSATMRKYLTEKSIEMSVIQQATIVFEYAEGKERISLLQILLEETNNEAEKMLLSSAIKDLQSGNEWISDVTQEIYNKNFPHKRFPLYPFLEVCGLPVLFKRGDVIRRCSTGSTLYYVRGQPLLIPEHCDFSDECYLCYPLLEPVRDDHDLLLSHEHIPSCEAERASRKRLTFQQRNIYRKIEMVLGIKPPVRRIKKCKLKRR